MGKSKVKIPIELDSTPLAMSLQQLQSKIESAIRATTTAGSKISGITGGVAPVKVGQDVPFTDPRLMTAQNPAGEGIARVTTEILSEDQKQLELNKQQVAAQRDVARNVKQFSRRSKRHYSEMHRRNVQQLKDEDTYHVLKQQELAALRRNVTAVMGRAAATVRSRQVAEQEARSFTGGVVGNLAKRNERFYKDRTRRQQQQIRDEDWLAKDVKKEAAERKSAGVNLGKDRSRMMMGVAGVATAAAMPISGFSPLTVGFASMSGVGYGIGAGIAVLGRAVFDINQALSEWRTKLIDNAQAVGATSRAYREQARQMEAVDISLGSEVADQRMGPKAISLFARRALYQQRTQGGRLWDNIKGVFGVGGTILNAGVGAAFPGRPGMTEAEANRAAINNIFENRKFSSSIVSGEAFYNKIATGTLSRRHDNELKLIKALEQNTAASLEGSKYAKIGAEWMGLALRTLNTPGSLAVSARKIFFDE